MRKGIYSFQYLLTIIITKIEFKVFTILCQETVAPDNEMLPNEEDDLHVTAPPQQFQTMIL
jgi:hypothetical protein